MTPLGSAADEYLAAATGVLESNAGPDALTALGWFELLTDLGPHDHRVAVFSLFRAQGRLLADSPALGALLAAPHLAALGFEPGSVIATLARPSRRGTLPPVVVGPIEGRRILVDRPGHGVMVLDADQVELRPITVPGRLTVHEVQLDTARWSASIDETEARQGRGRSEFLGRVAIAHEILGAAETAAQLAIEYARERAQFGAPIGQFQAVRHLLAWTQTDCVAVSSTAANVVRLDHAGPPMIGEILKALAGRNGRRACERALQVLGGIGFTAEHDHHHFHGRVLLLDRLLGASTELTHDLGEWFRTSGTDPSFARSILLGPPTS